MTPFVVFSLPRSRSAWLSVLLSGPDRIVGHDIGIECASPAEFVERLHGLGGSCETGAAFAWRAIRDAVPEVRFAVVLREPAIVAGSLSQIGLGGQFEEMRRRWVHLQEISALPGTFVCTFASLASSVTCQNLHRHCTGEELSEAAWEKLDGLNIQVDIARRMERLRVNRERIDALKTQVREQLVA